MKTQPPKSRRKVQKLVQVFGNFNRTSGYGTLWRKLLARYRRHQRWLANYALANPRAVMRREITEFRKMANRISLT